MTKTWNDQPEEVGEAKILLSFFAKSRTIEVRKASGNGYYVSVGNLFGSQSIRCEEADSMLAVVNLAASNESTQPANKIPSGCVILDNPSQHATTSSNPTFINES